MKIASWKAKEWSLPKLKLGQGGDERGKIKLSQKYSKKMPPGNKLVSTEKRE